MSETPNATSAPVAQAAGTGTPVAGSPAAGGPPPAEPPRGPARHPAGTSPAKPAAGRKRIIGLAMLAFVLAGAGIIGYYWYEGAHFVTSEDARVSANVVPVTPEIAGRILDWQIREGDRVTAGDIIGRQDLGSSLTSAAINPQGMANLGGILAEKAQFKAPISGLVIQSTAQVGQMVAPGSSLAIIADTDNLFISTNIKEGEIGLVKLGQEVLVKVDAFPDKSFRGQVENIGRATASTFSLLPASNSGGNFTKVTQVIPVKIHLFDTGSAGLMVGMNAAIRISLASVR